MSFPSEILVKGVVFSDQGRAKAFLGVDWVRAAIKERMGFDPYPGTLNLRIRDDDAARWEEVRRQDVKIVLPSLDPDFCNAFLFKGVLEGWPAKMGPPERIAVVLPAVKDYPADKLEIIAAVSLKQTHWVRNGDELAVALDV